MLRNNGGKPPDAASKGRSDDRTRAPNPSGKPLEALFPLFHSGLRVFGTSHNAELMYPFMMRRLYYSLRKHRHTVTFIHKKLFN